MSRVTRTIQAPSTRVWKVLADGWTYPLWVVGASRMRDVDSHWPAVGSLLHHSVGSWPALIDDTTEVVEVEPGRRLVLRARAWPAGDAEVILELAPQGDDCVVTILEDAKSGPGRLVPPPLRHAGLVWRNVETLRRLALLIEGRKSTQPIAGARRDV